MYIPFQTNFLPTEHQLGDIICRPVQCNLDGDGDLNLRWPNARAQHRYRKCFDVGGNVAGAGDVHGWLGQDSWIRCGDIYVVGQLKNEFKFANR